MMEQLVPKLRFPEFKEDWIQKPLKEIGKIIGGGTPSTSVESYWEGNIPWISSSDIFNNNINNISVSKYISEDAIKNSATKLIKKNSLLVVSRVGVGKFAVNNFDLCTSQDFANIIVDDNKSNTKYLAYSLLSKRSVLLNISQGTSIKGFTNNDLYNLKLTLPTLQEQTKIADFLGAVDKQLDILNQKKEKLNLYKKGVMQQLFAQQLRFKDDNGNNYPDWQEKTLGEVANIIMGQSPDSNSYNLEGQGLPLIQGNADIVNRISSPRQYTNHITKVSEAGDILFTVRAPVGAVGINNVKSCIGRGVASIRSNENQIFLYQYLLFIENDWEKFSQGSTFTAINSKDLKNYKFFVPKDKEQKKISNFLSAIDKQIESVSAQIQKTENYKKGLLQQMFV